MSGTRSVWAGPLRPADLKAETRNQCHPQRGMAYKGSGRRDLSRTPMRRIPAFLIVRRADSSLRFSLLLSRVTQLL